MIAPSRGGMKVPNVPPWADQVLGRLMKEFLAQRGRGNTEFCRKRKQEWEMDEKRRSENVEENRTAEVDEWWKKAKTPSRSAEPSRGGGGEEEKKGKGVREVPGV